MKTPDTAAKAASGVVVGLIWFVSVSASAVYQHRELLLAGWSWAAITVVVVVSGLCALGFRTWGAAWGWGVSAALALSLLLGLLEGPARPDEAAPQVISVPTIFSVGLGSVAVWVALGVSVALSLTASSVNGVRARDDRLEMA